MVTFLCLFGFLYSAFTVVIADAQLHNPYSVLRTHLLANYQTAKSSEEEKNKTTIQESLLSALTKKIKLSDYEKHQVALTILEKTTVPQATLSEETIHDLTLFFYDFGKRNFTVFEKIRRTQTALGDCSLAHMLITPTTDTAELKKRQDFIAYLVMHKPFREKLKKQIKAFAQCEDELLSLWNNQDIVYGKNVRDTAYDGDFTRWINKSNPEFWLDMKRVEKELVIAVSICMVFLFPSILAKFIAEPFIFPIINKLKQASPGLVKALTPTSSSTTSSSSQSNNTSLPASTTISGKKLALGGLLSALFVYSLSASRIIAEVKNRIQVVSHIKQRFTSLVTYVKALEEIRDTFEAFSEATPLFSPLHSLSVTDPKAQEFIEHLHSNTFTNNNKPYFLSLVGSVLYTLPRFLSLKDSFNESMHAIGLLDAFISIAELYEEGRNPHVGWNFPIYLQAPTPHLSLKHFWHPMLNPAVAVPSSVALGHPDHQNMVLTGPNAGGKSTILKGIILSALLSQTIGIAPCQKAYLTPFKTIQTHLNIIDDLGSAKSMFRAEVNRAQHLLSSIDMLEKEEHALIALDEMFNSVTPQEGEATAYSTGRYLAHYPNVMTLLVTHFPRLTQLPEATNGVYENYKVTVERNEDGSFHYPFTLEQGPSNQVIALELLKQDGFDPHILSYAYHHLERDLVGKKAHAQKKRVEQYYRSLHEQVEDKIKSYKKQEYYPSFKNIFSKDTKVTTGQEQKAAEHYHS